MKKSLFFKMFPPPVYLQMPAIGFDLSDRSAKYVEISKKNGEVFVRRFGRLAVPEGIIEEGEIKKKDELVEFLKSVKNELKSEYLIVNLPEEKAYVVDVKMPIVRPDQIKEALELQLEEFIPLPAKEAIFDYEIIERPGTGSNCLNINLIAFSRSLVEDYRDSFVLAGFTPLAFELEIRASVRAIVPKNETRTIMFIDFGRTRTTFAIVSKSKIQSTSTIKAGGEELEKIIIKNLQINKEQADKLKKEKGFTKSKENEIFFNSILPVVSAIKDEALKYINYWNSHSEEGYSDKVSKVLLCGGDSNLIGFPEYLSFELKLPVELGNPWVNIFSLEENIPAIELRESLIYATALGLALRQWHGDENEFFA
ncbi:pilus assembly protein PilM [Candidatus Parcubacteria bacterium]|nr:pilus assembly protein PilM [Patescibacteria group bacterium]MBU4477155.1 pilus assembly protein PilM [Patescibacteria group bacterium]MCG2698916.1 pilus assembly protein PilM [Candidatus Parcubacteria bacterium]